jgi:ACS family tartrate transporter-like MFS transporter
MDKEQETVRKIKIRLLPILIAGAIICYIDRVNVAFAAPGMMKDLGFTATVYGFGAGLFFLPYILFEVPSNVILAKVGARVWFCRIMITWGLISGAMAFVTGVYSFYSLRALLAVAEAGFFPGIMYYLTLWFPAEYRARIIGIFFMALPLANVVGAPISGPILNLDGLAGFTGWQWLFLIEAVPAIVLAVVILVVLPDGPEKAKWLDPEERAWLTSRLEADKRATNIGHQSIWQALSNPMVVGLGVICFCEVVSNYGLGFFLPQILKGFGLNNVQTGLVAAIPFLVGSFGCYVWGRHSDYTHERKLHIAAALAIAGGFIGISTAFSSPLIQMILISIAGFGMFAYLGPFWAMSTAYVAGAGAAGAAAAVGAINSIANIGGFVSPYAIGYIRDATNSFTGGLLAITAVSFIGVALVFIVCRSVRVATPPPATRLAAD